MAVSAFRYQLEGVYTWSVATPTFHGSDTSCVATLAVIVNAGAVDILCIQCKLCTDNWMALQIFTKRTSLHQDTVLERL